MPPRRRPPCRRSGGRRAAAWAATPPRVRSEILRRAYDIIIARTEDLALLMTLEMASPWPRRVPKSPTRQSSSAGSPRKPCASTAG
ncbi:aldehyde dehydrogenase family protein [Streptomyces coeruleorubidus]|nr:aldehyde dehydrogenase family protein [Streptomyces coeruleorubidus]WDV56674.1 aldehyde dehydrogenase family protein [Streptomyces coeruleorubidus]